MKKRILKILVTAGPTVEMIDPVRFISNRSTGVMGYEIAKAAGKRKHKVTLISGPTGLKPPAGVKFIPATTVSELKGATLSHFRKADCLFMVAAVSDWAVSRFSVGKIKRGNGNVRLLLKPTPDILRLAGRGKGKRVLVGFSLETKDALKEARKKLKKKNLDIIVANSLSKSSNPFGDKKTRVALLYKSGETEHFPFLYKRDIARLLIDRVEKLYTDLHG